MGCGNSRSATIATPPQAKPGGTSNEGNNNQSGSEPGKISPQNNATATQNTQGIYLLTHSCGTSLLRVTMVTMTIKLYIGQIQKQYKRGNERR